jgi:hypothetical protein
MNAIQINLSKIMSGQINFLAEKIKYTKLPYNQYLKTQR